MTYNVLSGTLSLYTTTITTTHKEIFKKCFSFLEKNVRSKTESETSPVFERQ